MSDAKTPIIPTAIVIDYEDFCPTRIEYYDWTDIQSCIGEDVIIPTYTSPDGRRRMCRCADPRGDGYLYVPRGHVIGVWEHLGPWRGNEGRTMLQVAQRILRDDRPHPPTQQDVAVALLVLADEGLLSWHVSEHGELTYKELDWTRILALFNFFENYVVFDGLHDHLVAFITGKPRVSRIGIKSAFKAVAAHDLENVFPALRPVGSERTEVAGARDLWARFHCDVHNEISTPEEVEDMGLQYKDACPEYVVEVTQ